jgi:hypothetical protein
VSSALAVALSALAVVFSLRAIVVAGAGGGVDDTRGGFDHP